MRRQASQRSAPPTAILSVPMAQARGPLVLLRGSTSRPEAARRVHDELQLPPLIVLRQKIALESGGEAALRRKGQPASIDVRSRQIKFTKQIVLRLQVAALGAHD